MDASVFIILWDGGGDKRVVEKPTKRSDVDGEKLLL